MNYTVETPEGDFILETTLPVLSKILNLTPDAEDRLQLECNEQNGVCVLKAARPYIIGYVELHVWTTPPWKRIPTEEQKQWLFESQDDDVRDGHKDYAAWILDELSTKEVKDYIKEYEEDQTR